MLINNVQKQNNLFLDNIDNNVNQNSDGNFFNRVVTSIKCGINSVRNNAYASALALVGANFICFHTAVKVTNMIAERLNSDYGWEIDSTKSKSIQLAGFCFQYIILNVFIYHNFPTVLTPAAFTLITIISGIALTIFYDKKSSVENS